MKPLFGNIINLCYMLTDNFGYAIIIFTLFIKIILFPISLLSQKNLIKLFKILPLLEDLKARNEDDPNAMLKEQKALYKKEKYSSIKAILPQIIQIIILIGVVRTVYAAVDSGMYNLFFWGIDLSKTPDFNSALAIIPVLSAVSAFLLCFVQNSLNPLTKSQGFWGKWGSAIFLTAFSFYFTLVCQASVSVYWISGNIISMGSSMLCNVIYNPKKLIDYENRSIRPKLTKEETIKKKERRRNEKMREKNDVKRFQSENKRLVFYSESNGFYKYYKRYIDYIFENSDITIHYVTSDIDDQVFNMESPRFKAYYCGFNRLITVMMTMAADIVVMTMPDLEQYHIKRSLTKKDIEYIHICHGMYSFHLVYRKGAVDHFDTIFCQGIIHNKEIRAIEKTYGLKEKRLINVGFSLLDGLIEDYNASKKAENKKPQILIAPSWQKGNILEYCLDELLMPLLDGKYKIILRPHPEFIKRFQGKMKLILDKYGGRIGDDFEIQTDFSSNSTVYSSDLVITDWSSIAQEFSFTTKKPSLFINTPMKIMNPDWKIIGIEPLEIWIREKIGVSLNEEKLSDICSVVEDIIDRRDDYKISIINLMDEHLYNIGKTAEVGGEYIISRLKEMTNYNKSSRNRKN